MFVFLAMIFAAVVFTVMAGYQVGMVQSATTYDARVMAQQMEIYHHAAGRACTEICAQGTVSQADVTAELPEFRRGFGWFADGKLASISVHQGEEAYLVTYVADASTVSRERWGSLRSRTAGSSPNDVGFWTGVLTKATSTVRVEGERFWRVSNPTEGDYTEAARIDLNFVIPAALSAPMPDGTPVMINRM